MNGPLNVRFGRYVPPKYWHVTTNCYDTTFQKTITFVVTAVKM